MNRDCLCFLRLQGQTKLLPKLRLGGSLDLGTLQKGESDRATGATLHLSGLRIWNQGKAAALCRDAATGESQNGRGFELEQQVDAPTGGWERRPDANLFGNVGAGASFASFAFV